MAYDAPTDWSGAIGRVQVGATEGEGGTRKVSYRIGGNEGLPFVEPNDGLSRPLVAYELCDDPSFWSPLVIERIGAMAADLACWARAAETDLGADLVRLYLTSTKVRGFADFDGIGAAVRTVLESTALPLIVEGPNEPAIESEAFRRIGEAGEGERLLLGTAEATRYRSVAAAALAYHHGVIAQSPIDVNLAKQLNILLREIGVPQEQIVIDPYTGALGYGFEYSYSAMERVRYAALKGDGDLAMPMISSATDSLTIKEVRDAPPGEEHRTAIAWEVTTGLAAAVAGAAIVCVRHPDSVAPLRAAIEATWGGLLMALKALDIYKLLPKKNCKECGVPTCLTFAMKLASGKADIELCPYLDENAKTVLGASTRPPIRLVKVGVGERSFRVGDEFVFYRHEKTFYHEPAILFRVSDTWDEATITGVVHEVRDFKLTRVGQDLVLNGVAVANDSGDPAAFGRAVAIVEANAHLPEVLIADDPAALEAGLAHCGTFRPLLDGATDANAEAVCALAKKHGAPLVVRAPDFEPLVELVKRCAALGVADLVLDLDAPTPAEFVERSSAVRQLAIARAVPELGYPVYYDCSKAGELATAALSIGILKFGSVLVAGPLSRPETVAAMTLRQNVYTDPQKPIQMTPGLYRIGNPGPEAPVLMTVNFSLTFFTLQGYLESTRIPCYMLIVDTEGQSVLTAVAAGKLSETVVADAIKKFEVEDAVTHRKLIIPGYASPLSGAIEDATKWTVMVGPRDAADIGAFLETEWKG